MNNYKSTILLFFVLLTSSTYTYPQAHLLLNSNLTNFFLIPATYNIYEIEDSTEVFADAVIEGFFGISSDELEEMLLYEDYDDAYNEGKYDKGEAKIIVEEDSIISFDIKGESYMKYRITEIVSDTIGTFAVLNNGSGFLDIYVENGSLTLKEYYYDEKVDKSKFIRKFTLYEDLEFLRYKIMEKIEQFIRQERLRHQRIKEIKLAPTFGV